MTELALNFLGAFAVSVEGQPLTRFRSDKVRALLAYLALEPARSHPRQALAGLLWPEVTDKQALQSLRTALYYLRQTLDRTAPGLSRQLLTVTHHTVCFKTEAEPSLALPAIRPREVPMMKLPSSLSAAVVFWI